MTATVSPSARIERIRMGRNRSPAANRAPNGASTSSTNSSRLPYSREAAECPSMRQTMSVAKTSAIGRVPSCQASKASRMVCRLASVASLIGRFGRLTHPPCGLGCGSMTTRALVTGATSGLGLAMARALADAGARVAVTSRDAARAEQTAAELGRDAFGLALDARDEAAVAAGVAEVWERFGGLDLLVNNAGIGMRTVNPRFLSEPQPFWEVEPDGFRDVLETKATGCFLMARAVVPRMLEQGSGRIVMISMSKSTMVRRGFVPYGPSGAAVEALSRVMAADLADTPLTVNL